MSTIELKKNLLVVDDEVEITKSLSRQFRRKYAVFTATSAMDAIAIMEIEDIQVIISDQRMPGMTGVDFFSRIKEKYPDALKLILTGYSDIESVIGSINEGQVFRYINKPWNPAELDITVKEAFDKFELITNNKRLNVELEEANKNLEEKVKQRTFQLEAVNEKLKEINREKNTYVGMVSHDLRNPIGVARNFSELLLEDFDDYEDVEKLQFIGTIHGSCNYALSLITNFLDTSKIEAGILSVNLQPGHYLNFIQKTVKQNRIFARKKQQKIEVDCPEQDFEVDFDPDMITQVINNLLDNAIKYSQRGKEIHVSVFLEGNTVYTTIRDHGQVIPAEELGDLFKAYSVTSVKGTEKEKSTGLGLAIVKKMIDVHHGEISVESEEGKGSSFTFSLPLIQK